MLNQNPAEGRYSTSDDRKRGKISKSSYVAKGEQAAQQLAKRISLTPLVGGILPPINPTKTSVHFAPRSSLVKVTINQANLLR